MYIHDYLHYHRTHQNFPSRYISNKIKFNFYLFFLDEVFERGTIKIPRILRLSTPQHRHIFLSTTVHITTNEITLLRAVFPQDRTQRFVGSQPPLHSPENYDIGLVARFRDQSVFHYIYLHEELGRLCASRYCITCLLARE